MEIVTTVKDFPKDAKKFHLEPDIQIRVIVVEAQEQTTKAKKSGLPFLYSGFWEGEDTPTDLSSNVDHYLYDV